MYYDVISARYVENYKLHLTFENGRSGVVDFLKYIQKGGVFAQLEDLDYFKQFAINNELGIITWGEAVDVPRRFSTPRPHWNPYPAGCQK